MSEINIELLKASANDIIGWHFPTASQTDIQPLLDFDAWVIHFYICPKIIIPGTKLLEGLIEVEEFIREEVERIKDESFRI